MGLFFYIMTKELLLMRDVITKYHPLFKNNDYLSYYGIQHPFMFNVEKLVEDCLSALGGYSVVNGWGRDFDDAVNSDSKTVTVVNNSAKRRQYVIKIGNVDTKIGSLRVTVFNPITAKLDFLYLPKTAVQEHKEPDGKKTKLSGAKERIRTSWSYASDSYCKLEKYRLATFKELAVAM